MECFKPNKKKDGQPEQIIEFSKKFKKGFKTWQVVQMAHDQLVLFYETDEKLTENVEKDVGAPGRARSHKRSDNLNF